MTNDFLKKIVEEFAQVQSVKAVVLSGSSTNSKADELSDYDIYVYSDEPVSVEFRRQLAEKYADKYEVDNNFWENGDEWKVESDRCVDLMYRSCEFAENSIINVLENYHAQIGYSTCILFNIANSKILYDTNNWFLGLKQKANNDYPDELVNAILAKNYPILRNNISSYREQIKKAVRRNDPVSVNHRITALLASYFDIIFAINKTLHPGEKRLLEFIETGGLKNIPANARENIIDILNSPADNQLIEKIDQLLDNLDLILKKEVV